MLAITGVTNARISGNWSPIISRHVTAAAAGAPSYNISELHHHSSSNTTESPVKSFILAEIAHDSILQLIYVWNLVPTIPPTRLWLLCQDWCPTVSGCPWAHSGPLIISLWLFLFLYFTISTDQNVCWNLNTVFFLVAVHNQNIAWQRILIYSQIFFRWDYLIPGSLASDCQKNIKNQIQVIIIYPKDILNPFLDFFFFSIRKSKFTLIICLAEIIITQFWFHLGFSRVP